MAPGRIGWGRLALAIFSLSIANACQPSGSPKASENQTALPRATTAEASSSASAPTTTAVAPATPIPTSSPARNCVFRASVAVRPALRLYGASVHASVLLWAAHTRGNVIVLGGEDRPLRNEFALSDPEATLRAIAEAGGLVVRERGPVAVLAPASATPRPTKAPDGCAKVDLDLHRADAGNLLGLLNDVCPKPLDRAATGEVTVSVRNLPAGAVAAPLFAFLDEDSKLPAVVERGTTPKPAWNECSEQPALRDVALGCEPLDTLELVGIVDDEPARALFLGSHYESVRTHDFIGEAVRVEAPDGRNVHLNWRVETIAPDRVDLVLQAPEASAPIASRTFDLGCQDW